MRRGIGNACIFLGLVCLLCALGLLLYNDREGRQAETVSRSLLAEVQEKVEERGQSSLPPEEAPLVGTWDSPRRIEERQMPTVKVGDYDCIGILKIPVLDLELPVLTDWSYAKLKKAPCLYYGSYYEENFVIAAHNYTAHFGKLTKLHPGDTVIFTDAGGGEHAYEVALLETLPPEATESMLSSGFALSLYTCTLGGGSRVTVRCNAQ